MWRICRPIVKSPVGRLGWVGVLVFLLARSLMFAQGQNLPAPPRQEQKPASKPKRTWTEDDLITLRKPWDQYQIAREKKAEEEKAAKAAAETSKRSSAKAPEPPKSPVPASAEGQSESAETLPALEGRIEDAREKVAELERRLQAADRALYDSREDQRADAEHQRDAVSKELEKAREDLKLLEEKLRALKPAQQSQQSPPLSP